MLIATAPENARVLASFIAADAGLPSNPIVERTIAQLRKAKPFSINGLATIEGADVIRLAAPASIDQLELALNRIAAAADALGTSLVRSEKVVAVGCDGETIAFSITEGVRREKHGPTEKEVAEEEATRRKRMCRWNNPGSWDDSDFNWSALRGPEWDYNPTAQLAFELEQSYLLRGSLRHSFKDAKISALKTWPATSRLARRFSRRRKGMTASNARSRPASDRRTATSRTLASSAACRRAPQRRLDNVLEELALAGLRRLVAGLREENLYIDAGRMAKFLCFTERRLASREAALSAEWLSKRFEEQRLFGDDDHDFWPPRYY